MLSKIETVALTFGGKTNSCIRVIMKHMVLRIKDAIYVADSLPGNVRRPEPSAKGSLQQLKKIIENETAA